MKHSQRNRKRKFYAQSRTHIAQSPDQRLFLEAAAVGSITALEDFPDDVCSSQEQKMLAEMILKALPIFSDRKGSTALFVPTFCTAYQARIDVYSRDDSAYQRDKAALDKVGAKVLAKAFIVG